MTTTIATAKVIHKQQSAAYLNLPLSGWIGPGGKRRRFGVGVRYAASGGIALLMLLLGLLANFTVIGSEAPFGVVPFSCWIARSASERWSNRMKPTPFDRPLCF
uniref:Uncharacterized protein n=1 Tax=Anopheles merus TaxID=30066 RepID=A0A182UPN3_ANOME